MKLYLIKDKISGNIISTRTAENLDVFKRYLISNRIDLVKENNHSSLRLLKDCIVYECTILNSMENGDAVLTLGQANKVLDIETFFNEFDKKSGSLEDKI